MPVKTRRWNDRRQKDDGFRLLICRYRPRALPKADETWDKWWPDLGPSRQLHADFYGKNGVTPLTWDAYRVRYLEEMQSEQAREMIAFLAELVTAGKTVTLLCSSACEDGTHCHRRLLRELIEAEVQRMAAPTSG
jgi:uncharacterized protein YeaO (DUF488 family)